MRRALFLLLPLAVAGCVNSSASYYINGSDYALTVRGEQDYFWNDAVTLYLTTSRMPDCQRRVTLTTEPANEVQLDLYSAGDNMYALKSSKEIWAVETQTCGQLEPTSVTLGDKLGTFKLEDKKLVFEQAAPAAASGSQPAAPDR